VNIDNAYLGKVGLTDDINIKNPREEFQGSEQHAYIIATGYARDNTNSATSKFMAPHCILWDQIPIFEYRQQIPSVVDIDDVYAQHND